MKLILFIWQLPQHILAFFLMLLSRGKVKEGTVTYRAVPLLGRSAVTLGQFTFAGWKLDKYTLAHEYGHSIQSKYLGWLYLPLVGIPSILRCIYKIVMRKSSVWYQSGYPEKWATELGFKKLGIDL